MEGIGALSFGMMSIALPGMGIVFFVWIWFGIEGDG